MTTPDTAASRAGSATSHVVDLTDEEIMGLDGPDSEQVAPLPWAGRRTPAETVLAAEVGLRGLVAHGPVKAGEDGLLVPSDMADALDLRHDARTIVYADHSTPTTQETRLLYIHPEVVLSEDVNAAGVHRFWTGPLDDALVDLSAWSEPARHETQEGSLEGEDLPAELVGLQSVVCLDVVSLREDDDVDTRTLTLYRLADGTAVEGVEVPGRLDLPPRSIEEVHARVVETVLGVPFQAADR